MILLIVLAAVYGLLLVLLVYLAWTNLEAQHACLSELHTLRHNLAVLHKRLVEQVPKINTMLHHFDDSHGE